MEQIERYRGRLLGLATGNAIGATLELMPPGSFKPKGEFGLKEPLLRFCG